MRNIGPVCHRTRGGSDRAAPGSTSTALAEEVGSGKPAAVDESRATLRGNLLRDYRDKAAQYLGTLRAELAATARALEEIMESLGQADGEHEARLRGSTRAAARGLFRLREDEVPAGTGDERRPTPSSASLEEMRNQHQVAVVAISHGNPRSAQAHRFAGNQRVDGRVTEHVAAPRSGGAAGAGACGSCLLLIRVSGLPACGKQFRTGGGRRHCRRRLPRRLRNSLPPGRRDRPLESRGVRRDDRNGQG